MRFSTGSCSLSNSTSASCFGELMLNSPPASSKISFVRRASSCSILLRLRRERRAVEPHARLFDGDEHRDERLLERVVDAGQVLLLEPALQDGRELARQVGPLARVIERGFDRHVGQRHRLRAASADVLFRQRLVAGVLERQILEPVGGGASRRSGSSRSSCRCRAPAARRRGAPARSRRTSGRGRSWRSPRLRAPAAARPALADRHRRRVAERPVAGRHVVGVAGRGRKRQADDGRRSWRRGGRAARAAQTGRWPSGATPAQPDPPPC